MIVTARLSFSAAHRLHNPGRDAEWNRPVFDLLGMTVGFNLDDLEASGEAARPYMMHEDTRLPAIRLPIRTTAARAPAAQAASADATRRRASSAIGGTPTVTAASA